MKGYTPNKGKVQKNCGCCGKSFTPRFLETINCSGKCEMDYQNKKNLKVDSSSKVNHARK